MSVHISPKPSMTMPMPSYASDSTMLIFDISRASATSVVPTNPPDNPFSNNNCGDSPNSGHTPRLPEIGQYGEADLSPGLRRLSIDSTYLPNRRDTGSPRSISGHECSASFEATQYLAQSLLRMRALGHGRPLGRMPQAPIPGSSGMVHPPAGLVAPWPRRQAPLPIPTFEVAPTIPLPNSPWTGSARTGYQCYDEEDVADNASAVLAEANNTTDSTYTDFTFDDDEGASISRVQMSYLSPSNFDSLSGNEEQPFAQAHDSSYLGAYGDDSFLSNYNDEGDPYSFAPHESPVLRAASPRTSLGSPPSAPAPVPSFNRGPTEPRPVPYQRVNVSDSDDAFDSVNRRTGRPEILPEDSPFGAAINGYSPAVEAHHATPPRAVLHPIQPLANDEEADSVFNFHSGTPTPAPRPSQTGEAVVSHESPALHAASLCAPLDSPTNTSEPPTPFNQEPAQPSPVQCQQASFSGTRDFPKFRSWRTGRLQIISDEELQAIRDEDEALNGWYRLSLEPLSSAYNLRHIPSHLPLSMDNSNEGAHSVVNTLPPLRTPSPYNQSDSEDQVLPSIQTLGLPTLKKPEAAEDGSLAIREQSSSSVIGLGSSTPNPWDEIAEEKRLYKLAAEAERYEADNESGDD